MPIIHETTQPKDYREYALEQYIESELELAGAEDAHTRSLRSLAAFFSNEVLPVIDNFKVTNQILAARKAPLIKERAIMKSIIKVTDISDDLDIEKGNNFLPKFIFKDRPLEESPLPVETIRDLLSGKVRAEDIELPELDGEEYYPEPVTAEELKQWHKGELEFKGNGNHSYRTAFKRMYAMFPDFTTNLVLKVNSIPRSQWHSVEAQAYIAYNIMAQLVDKDDRDVTHNGIADPNHLT
jgi:hypothetical protein